MNKSIIFGIFSFLALSLIWYLFIKNHDYKVTFREVTSPSIIYDAINDWGEKQNENSDIQVVTKSVMPLSEITQYIKKNDSSYILTWKIKYLNDSLSSVKVYISEKNNSLKNRLLIPFIDAPIEKYAINTVTNFMIDFKKYLKKFKIKINGKDSIPSAFCICKSVNTTKKNKAAKMVLANLDIMAFLRKNNLIFNGKPYLQVTSWDEESKKITFNFCFPTTKNDTFVENDSIFYKEIKSVPALKATYNGNYRYSDRSWNYLLNYAKIKKIKVESLPTELFFNDPQQGGQELDWKAEIFMPIIE